jgi:3-oxoadipate enol-lactonase
MTTSTTGFAPVNGAKLYYETAGAGRPLVFVHAGLADSGMWDDQFGAFASHYRVIRYDMRGFGQSVPVKGEYSHAEDLAGLLHFLGERRPSLVGCSQGGSVILDFALAHPQAAAALVLVSASPVGLELDVPASPQFADLQAALLTNDWTAFLELSAQIWFDGAGRAPDQVDQEARKRLVGMYLRRLQLTRADPGKEKPVADPPAADRLGELNMPTLIVTGDRDLEFVHAAAAYMAERIPGAKTVVVPDAAHMLNMEHPAELNQLVLDFLSHVRRVLSSKTP